MRDLASTLERLAEGGARELYRGELGRELVRYLAENGGPRHARTTSTDYRVIWRRPIRVSYEGHAFVSNPPPSSGGVLIGYGLSLLDRLGAAGRPGSAEAIEPLVEVMREQLRARMGSFVGDLYRGGLARQASRGGEHPARRWTESSGARQASPRLRARPGRRTSRSSTSGETRPRSRPRRIAGSGVIVPGTGIHMNNMLGEYDLNPPGRRMHPGRRLTSMMAPSTRARPRRPAARRGQRRLAQAPRRDPPDRGQRRPPRDARRRGDRGAAHPFRRRPRALRGRLRSRPSSTGSRRVGYELVRWRRRNLYFGGAAAVERLADGSLAAAGDPRRGGHGIVVPA